MRIGILGTGTITTAVVRGLVGDGHKITVSERSRTNAAALACAYDNVTVADNQTVIDQSDVIFLGLMAEQAPDILGALVFRADQQVITLMAGASLAEADALVAPAQAVAIMMPFPSIAEGGSAIMMHGDRGLIDTLFGARNHIFALPTPDEMDAYLCAQAVLSPIARMLEDAGDWLGARVSDPAQGEAFLRHLVSSSLAATPAAALVQALNTPGGYNQRLRLHMEKVEMRTALRQGLTALENGD